MRVVLTGGGTGGHLYPALAVAEALRRRTACEFLFIGTRRGLESRVVPEQGFPFRTVWIGGLRRGRVAGNLLFPLKMAVSFAQSASILARFRPDAVLGTGGYVSWPVVAAAQALGRCTVVQEQNEAPGLVTRLLARRADAVHLSFEGSVRHFRRRANLHVSGNPTRAGLEAPRTEAAYRSFDLDPGRTTLFVFGGSQGAKRLNEAFAALAGELAALPGLQVLWATGPRWHDASAAALPGGPARARFRLRPYVEDMAAAYAVSDLVVCRSGAGAVAEIARLGKPAVFVPFPGAAGGHQAANARALSEAGAALCVEEGPDLESRLRAAVWPLLGDPDARGGLASRVRAFGRPEAADAIARQMIEVCPCPEA